MNDLFSLDNKNILITGASSGIGRQCAISCSDMGANVILLGRNPNRLEETFLSLKTGNHLTYTIDLKNTDAIDSAVSDAVVKIGKISGFIHSAGIETTLPLKNMKVGNYEELFAVNVIAGFEIARILANKRNFSDAGASFVFISSVMSVVGEIGKIGYCSSKGALIAGAKSMALELATKKIRVNSISPAMVQTEMAEKLFEGITYESKLEIIKKHPLGIGEPIDIAAGCLFLLSEASKWITGTNLIIDGGYSAK